MFTGIVTEVGRVTAAERMESGVVLAIEAPETASRLSLGTSVSVNGVCQTVVDLTGSTFRVQAVGATLEKTTLGRLTAGAPVNLEGSLRVGDELGGHLVMGHVDGTGRIVEMSRRDDALFLSVRVPDDLKRFAAPRGSLAIDGVSLTIAGASGNQVVFSIIPHTLTHTIVKNYRVNDDVNVEVDLLARYLDRLLSERSSGTPEALTWELLKEKFS